MNLDKVAQATKPEATDIYALFGDRKAWGKLPAGVYVVRIEDSVLKMSSTNVPYIVLTGTTTVGDVKDRDVSITLFEHENFNAISRFAGQFAEQYDMQGMKVQDMLRNKPWVGKDFTFTYQHQVNGTFDNHNWVVGEQELEYIKQEEEVVAL